MDNIKNEFPEHFEPVKKPSSEPVNKVSAAHIVMPLIACASIIAIILVYAHDLTNQLVSFANYSVEQTSNRISSEIAAKVSYAKSSILSLADSVAMEMTGDILENPAEIIEPLAENTPFELIEYIQPDGMNTMNIGQPFDASQREYYIEGIKGNSGIWENYHPKYSKETLLNFYTPIFRNEKIVGVLTGAIGGTAQLTPILESSFYGEKTFGLLIDSQHMVIASTLDGDYTPEQKVEDILDNLGFTEEQKTGFLSIFDSENTGSVSFDDPNGTARLCASAIPNTDWYVIEIVPSASFNAIVNKNTHSALLAIMGICLVLVIYLSFILISGARTKKRITRRNQLLEEENARINKQNKETFDALRKAVEAADEANNAKTVFLNNMSHDIRTPMNAILGFTSLMEDSISDTEKLKDYLGKIKSSGEFLLSLINNVLEMAKIESGKVQLDETRVNLREAQKQFLSVFDAEIKKKKLTCTYSLNIEHECVYLDETKDREIFTNLISNAIKYTTDGGKIDISVTELPQTKEGYTDYRIIVSDTGIGMSAQYIPHIFDSFVREHNSTECKISGTGLGLPIVKSLVDLMGGTIEVESELGKGTKFTVTLSHRICEKSDIQEVDNSDSFTDISDMNGKRILLAEDNELNAEIAIAILENAGFFVERAADGIICVDMVEKAEAGYYNLILMDIQMPNMDGYKATKVIRRLPDAVKADIPIVAMTANAFEEDKKSALESGMNGFIAKPIQIPELMRTLSLFLK